MFCAVDEEASVRRRREPEGMSVASLRSRIVTRVDCPVNPGVGMPPSLITVSPPPGISAERTATRCGQPDVDETETVAVAEPNVSRAQIVEPAYNGNCARHILVPCGGLHLEPGAKRMFTLKPPGTGRSETTNRYPPPHPEYIAPE